MSPAAAAMTASPPDVGRVLSEPIGDVLVITLDRPAKLNGVTPEMARQLAEAYTRLEAEDALRVGLVCAKGTHFTAGLDLPRFAENMANSNNIFPPELTDPCDLFGEPRRKPVVFAVQGICFTIGVELMLAGDIVVAASDCRFCQLEVKRGILPSSGGTIRIAERAGVGNAMRILLTGDEFSADEALRFGLVQRVTPPGQQFDEALAIAQRIAAAAPLAVREARRNVLLGATKGAAAALAELPKQLASLAKTEDAREGVRAFVERRPPRFVGR